MKHLEIKTIETHGVKVMVQIDYDNEKISLVQKDEYNKKFEHKKYVFVERGVVYMKGWLDVLDAMRVAITLAEKELSLHLAIKQKQKDDLIVGVMRGEIKDRKKKK